ncbi:MAG: hypothetical protein HY731_07620 [Candidatus Tectomicrobia bacterium]|nr:hypothetical protein [Candidatus Tectomicrobia bacterium]
MGYVRSGLRLHWHVYGVMRDTSPDAFTPTLGFATNMISVIVLIFMAFIAFIFWLGQLEEGEAVEVAAPAELGKEIAPQPAGGLSGDGSGG